MEENNSTELEEGEACYYKEEQAESTNIDPDIDLSYIDEKIQNVLGHFQKDFEGGVTAENLGAKFGGYGSFLPTYERSPCSPSALSRQRSPERSSISTKSQNNLSAEGMPRNLRAAQIVPPSSRFRSAQCNGDLLHNEKLPSVDLSSKQVKQEPPFRSDPVAENPTKGGALVKSGNGANQRVLKLRIKVGSDNKTRTNTALYCGLGLEGSPSTSLGSSSHESGGFPSLSAGTNNESPGSILQVMTSLPVLFSDLISPLHESLLSLAKEEVDLKDNKPAENVKVNPGQNTVSVDQLVTVAGDAMLPNLKKPKSESRNETPMEVKSGNCVIFNNGITIPMKKKIMNEMLNGEASLRCSSEKASLSSKGNVCGEPRKVAAKASDVVGEANNVKERRKLKSKAMEESPLKPISGSDYGPEVKNRQKITILKAGGRTLSSSKGAALFDSMENGKLKGDVVSALPKDRWHVDKNEEEFASGETDILKWKADHDAPCHENSETGVAFRDEKPLIGGMEKSKGSQSDDRAILSGKSRLKIVAGIAGKEMKRSRCDIPPSKTKVLKRTSRKHITGRGYGVDAPESLNGENNYPEAPAAGRQGDVSSTFPVVENNYVLANSRERDTNGVASSSLSAAPVKGSVDAGGGVPNSEMVPEDWVACDRCEKWRLLPNGKTVEGLPTKWMCSMLDWLPGMNNCEVPQDVTTELARGPIAYPGFENQAHADGPIVSLGQQPSNVSTVSIDGQGKYKLASKKMLKKYNGEPFKSRSLNNMNDPAAQWNSLRVCNLPENKAQDLALGESIPKKKEKNLMRGDRMLIKEKSKRKSDQFENETSKRDNRDEISSGAKCGKSDTEVRRSGPSSGTPKFALAKGKGSRECSSSKEVKHGTGGRIIVSMKNLNNQTQVPTDCASVGLKASSSSKKRKLKGSQDSQVDGEPYEHSVPHRKLMVDEETEECVSRKGKKSRFSDTVLRDSSGGEGNNRSKKEGKVIQDFSSGIGKHFTDGVEEDWHSSKKRRQLAPKQATSSSSKVSGSQKSRINYEVQGSPVGSVSSSPLRVINSTKFTSMAPDVLTRGATVKGDLPVMNNVSKGSPEKVNGGSKQSGIVTAKESRDFHSRSVESGFIQRDAKPFSKYEKGHILEGTTNYPQHGESPVDNTSHGNGVYKKQSATPLCVKENRDDSSLTSKGKGRNSASDSDRDNAKGLETAHEKAAEPLNKGKRKEPLVKENHAGAFSEVRSHMSPHPTQGNVKTHIGKRDLSEQNKQAQLDGRIDNRYSDYGLESPNENTHARSNCGVEAAPLSAESMSGKGILPLHPQQEAKQGTPTRGSQLGKKKLSDGMQMHAADNSDLSKALLTNKKNGASNHLGRLTSEMQDVKDPISSSPSGANQSVQTACSVLKEAEKHRELADRLKGNNFGFEANESYFEAAIEFLHGASLIETGNGDSSKSREMTPLQVYSTAAKLCESCAAEYERCQEQAAAALAYKCMEVAYMRVVYCKYASLSRDRHELQATLQQGDSPSSSASDIDDLNNQAVADRSNLSKGVAGSHAVGNHILGARNRPGFMRLLDFTQGVNLAMEASRKSQVAFLAAKEESQNKEHIITSLKGVIDFSFQDIDGLVCLVKLARKAISRSGFSSAKD